MTLFGGVFSAKGYSPDPEKIQGITDMTPPQTKQELVIFRSGQLSFVLHLSHNTEPLWMLLKKDNIFAWDENSQHMLPENQVPPSESIAQTTQVL